MILHLILTSVLKELWCDKSFFLCLNKKLSLHFLNKVCMFAAYNISCITRHIFHMTANV